MAVVEVGDTLLSLVISIVQTVKRFVRQLSVTREKRKSSYRRGIVHMMLDTVGHRERVALPTCT